MTHCWPTHIHIQSSSFTALPAPLTSTQLISMPWDDNPYKVLIVDQCIAMWWNQSCMRFATKKLRKYTMKSPPTHCHCLTLTQTPPIAKMLHDNKRCHFWTVTEAAASHVTVTYIGFVTWCWPLSVRLMLTPVRSPMLCLTCEVPYDAPRLTLSWSWFTQTPLPLWMTVPDNGPISFLTPLPFSAFSSVLSSNYFFSSFAELFQFWGWMLGDPLC